MPTDPFRVLISYHYFKDNLGDMMALEPPVEMFCDSGAFSALSLGANIDVHDYGRWLAERQTSFRVMANLDVIGADEDSAEGTWRNQRLLEDEYGLSVLPVFHAGEPWSALDRLLEHGYRYIGLGGLVGRPVKTIMPWLVQCFRRCEGKAALHGFGLTNWLTMSELPWFSVDSSAWGSGYRWGLLRMWDPVRGRLTQLDIGRRANKTKLLKNARLVRSLGVEPTQLIGDTDRALLCAVSARAWRQIETMLRQRHGVVTIPGGETEGPSMYASSSHPGELRLGNDGLRMYAADSHGPNLKDGARGLRVYVAGGDKTDYRNGNEGLRLYLADGSSANITDGNEGLRLYLADTNRQDLRRGNTGLHEGVPTT